MADLPSSPAEILALPATGADALLTELERRVRRHAPLVALPTPPGGRAFVFGDSHGDWRSTRAVVRAFEEAGDTAVLLGLGDYVDRAPADLPGGSVVNALFLLSRAAQFPDRVFLLQGNHETVRTIPCAPHHLPQELDRLWGRSPERYDRLLGLLERGPLAATSASGAYFAHAGFPRAPWPVPWSAALDRIGEERLAELVWSECDAAVSRRGVVPPWGAAELRAFLAASGLSTVWRGHDPEITGRPLYDARAMTLQTTRLYARFGDLYAVLPLDRALGRVTGAELRPVPPAPRDGASD